MDLNSGHATLNGSNGKGLHIPFAAAAGVTPPPMASKATRQKHVLARATRAFLLNEIQQRHIDAVAKDLSRLVTKPLGSCRTQLQKLVSQPEGSYNSTSRAQLAKLHRYYFELKQSVDIKAPAAPAPVVVVAPAEPTMDELAKAGRALFPGLLPPRGKGRPPGAKNKPKDYSLSIRRPQASDMAKMQAELEKTRSEIEVLKETVASLAARSAHVSPATLVAMSEYDRRYEAIMRFIEQSKEPVTMPVIRASIPETFSATKKILEKGVRLKRIKEVTNPWTHILEYWKAAR